QLRNVARAHGRAHVARDARGAACGHAHARRSVDRERESGRAAAPARARRAGQAAARPIMSDRLIDVRTPLAVSEDVRVEIGGDGTMHVLLPALTLPLDQA